MDNLEKINLLLDNPTFSTVSSLVLALYAGMAAPALPNSVILFFDTIPGKVLFLFLIGFMASRNTQVALMLAVAFVVTLHVANQRATEEYINFIKKEKFTNEEEDIPVENYDPEEHPMSENYISDDQTEQFKSYKVEGFADHENDKDGDMMEEDMMEEDMMEEDMNEEEAEVAEDVEEEDVEEEDVEEEAVEEEDVEEDDDSMAIEEFYSSCDKHKHVSKVKPAHNLSGNPKEMFAPVKFN